MKTALLSLDSIEIPDDVERSTSRVEDDLLLKSIQQGGIQQPLVVIAAGGQYALIDGLRRFRAAQSLGISKVPAVIDAVPAGASVDDYRRKIRFILDEHRQDLLPSQKAELIETLKTTFSMNHKQVSAYLGVDSDTVTNWLSVKKYIPPVVAAIDAGAMTMQAARAFDGMSEHGQEAIWKQHGKDLTASTGGKLHKQLRAQYTPQSFPSYYRQPEIVAARLARKGGKRKVKVRATISTDEKKRMLNSYELKETELRDAQAELKELKSEINAAIPVVAAIMRNEKLLAMVPESSRQELSRFAEIYV